MKYDNPVSFRQALQDRIRAQTDGDGARTVRERKRIAFDRLLARLVATASGRWLLKGGFALDMRLVDRARSTKDVDIDWQASEEELLETRFAGSPLRPLGMEKPRPASTGGACGT